MRISERIAQIVQSLPPEATVELPVAALAEWLEETGSRDIEPDLTVSEIAELYNRSTVTVRAWIRNKQLRGYLFRNKEYRVPRSALEEFISAERGENHPE